MTVLEYAVMRQLHRLEEAGRRRQLTDEELEFLRLVAPLVRRLAQEEQRSVMRSRP